METYEAIITRRSVPKLTDEVPDRASVRLLLEAGVRAPTHHLTQPWRFLVLTGAALEEFGEAWATGAEREGKDPTSARAKSRRAPVIVVVIETPKHHLPKVQEVEEHHAVGAAMQNMLLAAHDMGWAPCSAPVPRLTSPRYTSISVSRRASSWPATCISVIPKQGRTVRSLVAPTPPT